MENIKILMNIKQLFNVNMVNHIKQLMILDIIKSDNVIHKLKSYISLPDIKNYQKNKRMLNKLYQKKN